MPFSLNNYANWFAPLTLMLVSVMFLFGQNAESLGIRLAAVLLMTDLVYKVLASTTWSKLDWGDKLVFGFLASCLANAALVSGVGFFGITAFIYFLGAGLGYFIFKNISNPSQVIPVFIVYLVLLVATGGYQYFTQAELKSLFMDNNSYVAALNLGIFIACYMVLSGNLSRRWILVTGSIIVLALILWALPYSRGSFMGMLLGAGILVAGVLSKFIGLRNVYILLVSVLILALGASYWHFDDLMKIALADSSWEARVAMWQSSFAMFKDYPLFGVGLGMWFSFYQKYRLPGDTESGGFYAHNDFVQLMAETGLVPLIILLALIGVSIVALIRKVHFSSLRSKSEWPEIIALYGFVVFSAHSSVNFLWYNAAITPMAGVLLGLGLRKGAEITIPFEGSNSSKIFQKILAGSLALFILSVFTINTVMQIPRKAAYSVGSFESNYLSDLGQEPFLELTATPNFPLFTNIHAKYALSLKYQQKVTNSALARDPSIPENTRLALYWLAEAKKVSPWNYGPYNMEASFLLRASKRNLLDSDTAIPRAFANITQSRQLAPWHPQSYILEANLIKQTKGCQAGLSYLAKNLENATHFASKFYFKQEYASMTAECLKPK